MKKFARGFGLVEIMVALVLGLVVTLGIIQIFAASRGTYVTQNSSARMQEDARFVLSKLIQEVRMAGMFGCLSLDNVTLIAGSIAKPAAFSNPILWDNATSTLTLISADVSTAGSSPTWTVVSDCQTSTQIYSGAVTPATGFTAFPLRQLTYTLSGTNLKFKSGTGTDAAQSILSNVAALEVSFGMGGNYPMSYSGVVTTAAAANIRSVRIRLTLQDPDNRVRSQTYSVVAALRNRF
ncbi:MAG TPA: prepilin-type N-terminal cleavage/methylation domain-containing protein [Pseudomonas sp.]|jgi:type IV pilus assembly protein PilW